MVDGNITDLASLLFNVSYVFMYKPRSAGAMAGISGSGSDLQEKGDNESVQFDPSPWIGPCRRERMRKREREGRRGGRKREGGTMVGVTIVLEEFLIYVYIVFYDI